MAYFFPDQIEEKVMESLNKTNHRYNFAAPPQAWIL